MLRRVAVAVSTIAVTTLLLSLGSGGCSHTDRLNLVPNEAAPPAPVFVDDAGVDAAPDAIVLTNYCPSTSCTAPFATCPTSQYPCDTNIMSSLGNCGSCGFSCDNVAPNATGTCNSGKCAIQCQQGSADCNGVIDDGCEVVFGTDNNCNSCGDKCPDPAKPCIYNNEQLTGQCGCTPGLTLCKGFRGANTCIDVTGDDNNCGACKNVCDPKGDGGVLYPNTTYGCGNSACGQIKCTNPFADCNHDLVSDGCETNLHTPKNCGACGKACDPGQSCIVDPHGNAKCVCPPGLKLCGTNCIDVATDPMNCGGCDNRCDVSAILQGNVAFCLYGTCTTRCAQGWGDCNGDPKDGCETNLNTNQRNCGACGHSCDVAAGQPCSLGQCAVEPCEAGVVR